MEIETRAAGELRAVEDSGEFEGYIAVWDTVDSYNSTFTRGAFKKTISERADRIKVFYNHDKLIGKCLDIREDSHGVWVRGKLSLDVEAAREAHAFMSDGVTEGLSFGFRCVKEGRKAGVREIREVQLLEFGPVVFPANDAALITDVRADQILEAAGVTPDSEGGAESEDEEGGGESRATDFNETELSDRHFRLIWALEITLWDCWWEHGRTSAVPGGGDPDSSGLASAIDTAISDFAASYMEYVEEAQAQGARSAPARNELASAVAEHVATDGRSLEEIARDTSLTMTELRALTAGRPIEATAKVAELSDTVAEAHEAQRGEAAEALLREVRAGLSPAHTRRLQALLKRGADAGHSTHSESGDETGVLAALQEFRTQIEE
ncbi:MAG TPA: HK97 family phage prohead protease [Gammaproteobacteria bacterium]|nr:HK97 family phage prohead protease [Gammaproteobacteria bacterium]